MSLCERVAAHPRVEGLAVAPPRYDEHLVACIGSQYLHGDEPRETLNITAALTEPLDDPVGRPLLHREAVEDRYHSRPRLNGRPRCRFRRRVWPSLEPSGSRPSAPRHPSRAPDTPRPRHPPRNRYHRLRPGSPAHSPPRGMPLRSPVRGG